MHEEKPCVLCHSSSVLVRAKNVDIKCCIRALEDEEQRSALDQRRCDPCLLLRKASQHHRLSISMSATRCSPRAHARPPGRTSPRDQPCPQTRSTCGCMDQSSPHGLVRLVSMTRTALLRTLVFSSQGVPVRYTARQTDPSTRVSGCRGRTFVSSTITNAFVYSFTFS